MITASAQKRPDLAAMCAEPAITGDDVGMADEKRSNQPQDLLNQLWTTMERLGAAAGQMPAMTGQMLRMPTVPMPGGLAAGQISAIAGAIRAQRSGIATMRANLDAYEQQLAVMEQLMEPLEEMTKSWAQAEKRITG
jgi:hypothetical protein